MKFIGLLFIIAFLSSCHKQPATSVALQGRLDAANLISEPNARNEALGKLAIDAAGAKDIQIATAAIESINEPNRKNSTAETCALVLSRNVEPKAATAVAQLISDPNVRNRTLQAIAQGQ